MAPSTSRLAVRASLLLRLSVFVACALTASSAAHAQQTSGPPPRSADGPADYLFDLKRLAPPRLAYDFYPHGLTRAALLQLLPGATKKTGRIDSSETWQGVIHVTGDLTIGEQATVTVQPGTIVLIAALSDDQHSGHVDPTIDAMNPKKAPATAEYVQNRVEIVVNGTMIAKGTRAEPIIFTSDAAQPGLEDWITLHGSPRKSVLQFDWVLIEYARGVNPSNVGVFSNSIVRNLGESFLVGEPCEMVENYAIRDNGSITNSYVYNSGQGLQIRWGKYAFTNNAIFVRPDVDRFDFLPNELHGIGNDFPTQLRIENNYIEAGPPTPYRSYVRGQYFEYIYPSLLTVFGYDASAHVISANTLYYPYYAGPGMPDISVFPSGLTFANNNVLFHPQSLALRLFKPLAYQQWESPCHFEAAKRYTMSEIPAFAAPANYWGSPDSAYINQAPRTDAVPPRRWDAEYNVTPNVDPIRTQLNPAAFPDWRASTWLDVTSTPTPPTAKFTGPATGYAGRPVTFDASGSTDPDGTVQEYFWLFGDGTTGSGPRPDHTFPAAGTYRVGLIVRDNDYAWSTDAAYGTVTVETPLAPGITVQPANQFVRATFTAQFSATAVSAVQATAQWQVSTDSGATWRDVAGATSAQYYFTATTADSGKQFRVVFSNPFGTATSGAATLTVQPMLTVTGVSPVSGPKRGGTVLTITGSGFTSGATVSLAAVPATNVTVLNGTTVQATVPANLGGIVDVLVTNPGGDSGALANAFVYTDTHPADADGNGKLTISEVTAYGSAWKRGLDWLGGPNPIPISYVTRAGYLWRNGEAYQLSAGDCPACWLVAAPADPRAAGRQADARPAPTPVK